MWKGATTETQLRGSPVSPGGRGTLQCTDFCHAHHTKAFTGKLWCLANGGIIGHSIIGGCNSRVTVLTRICSSKLGYELTFTSCIGFLYIIVRYPYVVVDCLLVLYSLIFSRLKIFTDFVGQRMAAKIFSHRISSS